MLTIDKYDRLKVEKGNIFRIHIRYGLFGIPFRNSYEILPGKPGN